MFFSINTITIAFPCGNPRTLFKIATFPTQGSATLRLLINQHFAINQ